LHVRNGLIDFDETWHFDAPFGTPDPVNNFWGKSPAGQTVRRIFTLGESICANSRMQRHVPFWVLGDIACPLGDLIDPKPNFGVVNKRFQAKCAQILKLPHYRNYCIDCNQILQNHRHHQGFFVGGKIRPKQIQDNEQLPSRKKNKNCNISTTD